MVIIRYMREYFYNLGSADFGNDGSGATGSSSTPPTPPTSVTLQDTGYLYHPFRYNASVALSMSAPSDVDVTLGQSIYNGVMFRAGETLNGLLFNAINSDSTETSPTDLTYVGFVTGANEASGGTSGPWGSGIIGLFGKNVLAKGTNVVSCEYSTAFATTGTILFETPLTFTSSTSVYLNVGGLGSHNRVGREGNTFEVVSSGTTITYGTASSSTDSNIAQIKPLVTGKNMSPDLWVTQTAIKPGFTSTDSCGMVIKPAFSGVVDGIWMNLDVDYIGHLYICDNANGNNIIGSANLTVSRPNTSGDTTKIFRLESPISVVKDGTYTITGTANNATGNLANRVVYQDAYMKSLSRFANTTYVTCSRVDNAYPISGTTLDSSLYGGLVFNSIST